MTDKLEKLAEHIKELPGSVLGFLKTKGGKICVAVAAVVLAAVIGIACYNHWLYQQTKFHGMTIELGDPLPEITEFLTEYANPKKAVLVTSADEIDLSLVGEQTLTFSHGKKVETVTLTIQDTTAPEVAFQDVSASIRDTLVPEAFVASVTELSEYTVSFVQEPQKPESYDGVTIVVQVTDAYGNTTSGECAVDYRWMMPEYTLELGKKLGKGVLLYHYEQDKALLDQAQLDKISNSPVGTYTITSASGDAVNECVITIQDTTAPKVQLQDVTVFLGETAALEDFLVFVSDASGNVTTRLVQPLKLDEAGTYTVVVEAEDASGNIGSAEAELRVIVDTVPPEFTGMDDMYVAKHSSPNYDYGVTAVDARDGEVEFTVDTSRVNMARAGTYYAVYSAKDKEGNVGTFRRKVVVSHDYEDTVALVSSIASGLGSGVETLRDYVRDEIWYSSSWGGDDPIWYGFKYQSGNCYVHALCFQALLREKGYETQLIWVTDKSHYWNLVNINGQWKHMDSTPGDTHSRYSIMNDAQRYETLNGRNWDRTAWPVVE